MDRYVLQPKHEIEVNRLHVNIHISQQKIESLKREMTEIYNMLIVGQISAMDEFFRIHFRPIECYDDDPTYCSEHMCLQDNMIWFQKRIDEWQAELDEDIKKLDGRSWICPLSK